MRRFAAGVFTVLFLSLFFGGLVGCGGGSSSSSNLPTPAKVTLAPANSSLDLGATLQFTATATTSTGTSISTVPVVYTSSNPAVLTFVPSAGGLGCAGRWDPSGQVCAPQGAGVAQVTAAANGVVSAPVTVYVHQHLDTVQLSLLNPPTPFPDCISLAQVVGTQNYLDFQAQAFSNGVDVTNTVGSFAFSQTSASVTRLSTTGTGLNNNNGNQITQARFTAIAPGITQIFANVSGVTSLPAMIPDSKGNLHPYFETCRVQSINLQVGSAQTNTTFAIANSSTATITATVVDRLGKQLTNPPITFISLSPANATVSSSGAVSAKAPGGVSIVASCAPPTCNLGLQSIQPLVPLQPVYSSISPALGDYEGTPITGTISGAAVTTTAFATSTQCDTATGVPITGCQPLVYPISTSNNVVGSSSTLPSSPNSFVFIPAGTKAFLGSDAGLMTFTPGSTSSVPQMNNVPGKVLALSLDGNKIIVSDTKSIPNQVYIIDQASGSTAPLTSLFISGAAAAAFSPDGLKAFILGQQAFPGDTLYVYSAFQTLKKIALSSSANAVSPYANGALAYLSGGQPNAVTMINTCDGTYAQAAAFTVPRLPVIFQAIPDGIHAVGIDPPGLDIFTAKARAPAPATPSLPSSITCPFPVSASTPSFVNLGQGNFTPLKLIVAPDNSKAYVLASNLGSVFVYDFGVNTVSAIPLTGNPMPLDASMTSDGTLLYVGASDGAVHVVSTVSGGDLQQITFANNNSTNKGSLCSNIPQTCNPDLIAVQPK
jgi:uncharacterized protein YjdB